MSTLSPLACDAVPPICQLKIGDAWSGLTVREQLYAHHMSAACWGGSRIVMKQTSPGAQDLCDLVLAIYSSNGKLADLVQLQRTSGVSPEEFEAVLSFSVQVLSNLSNYKSFGATKFIPRCDAATFEALVAASARPVVAQALYDKVKSDLYSSTPHTIGKPATQGNQSAYYPSTLVVADHEVERVQALCDEAGVSTLNTRLSKQSDKEFTLLVASASNKIASSYPATLGPADFHVTLQAGDFNAELTAVNVALREAGKHAANDHQAGMIVDYERSFATGDIEAHKDGSRKWVKDKGPVVESYIGFIESYVDPWGSRAEWEGFVAIVNKEQSKKFEKLVEAAPALLADLPWGPDYEVKVFTKPDFTALEVLSFATSGLPAGINIPNYSECREVDGFKNVSLSNVLSAKAGDETYTFIAPDEAAAYAEWEGKAFDMQVANHELLGHGSGRLLTEDDRNVINPLTGKPIESWYKSGETYASRIGECSSSLEECRAESVALYLASNKTILELFGFRTEAEQHDLIYFTFLIMVRAGLKALEWYNPDGSHGQAHMQARLGIAKFLIEHNIASIEEVRSSTGELIDMYARVDKALAIEKGKAVMGKLLVEIQTRRSLGLGKDAAAFYKDLTTPSATWVSEYRPLVISKKLPRKIFVQANTFLVDGKVVLKEYPATLAGVVESFIERGI